MASAAWCWLLLSLGTTLAGGAGPLAVSIPVTQVPGSRQPDRPYDATLTLPDGTGRFPVVILLHGCGGETPSQQYWIDRLTGWGYAVLRLDSFSARGLTTVCAPDKQALATFIDRSGDVLSAALWLRTQSKIDGARIDGARIGVVGMSHGGGTAAAVTRLQFERLYPGLLKASVDYYGPCRNPQQHGTVPLLAMAGDADTWGYSARACQEFAAALRPDQPMQVVLYPGAVHDFDNPTATRLHYILGHPAAYDPSAATDSFAKVKAFLAHYLGGAP